MKKWILVLATLVLISSIYIFIPSKLTISTTIIGDCNINAANRFFLDTSKWVRWWPVDTADILNDNKAKTSFAYKNFIYTITKVEYSGVRISMQHVGDTNINSNIWIVQLNKDSCIVNWECNLFTGINPYKKIMSYQHATNIKKNMDDILNSFAVFAGKPHNIYGVDFHQTMSKDSTLVTMTSITNNYPSTKEIYQLVDSLKQYIISQDAVQINYPMLNVSKLNSTQYKTIVGISVNKRLSGNSRIIFKRFVPWKMIEGEVHGGVYSVDKAFEQFYNFKSDRQISVMAIPFQSLITDRSKEQDTTKWITKICAPIS